MTGRAAIHSHQKRIEAVFTRSGTLASDPELSADYAKYLCVLVSGFVEKSLSQIVLEHARRVGALSLQRYVEANTTRFTNANTEKILQLLGSFDPDWRRAFEAILVDQYKDAIDSVVSLRHHVAHGSSVSITYVQVKKYFEAIIEVIGLIQQECIPNR